MECMHRDLEAAKQAAPYIQSAQPARSVVALFLLKLAKHMALLVSLLLIGKTRGEPTIGALGTFLVIISSALIHSVGRWLQMRPAPGNRFRRGGRSSLSASALQKSSLDSKEISLRRSISFARARR